MMKTYRIYSNNGIFSLAIKDDWVGSLAYIIKIEEERSKKSSRSIICNLELPGDADKNKYIPIPFTTLEIDSNIKGLTWHEYGYGEVCEFCVNLKEKTENEDIIHNLFFYSGNSTNQFSYRDVAFDFVTFLNDLIKFEKVEDFIIWDKIKTDWHKDKALQRHGGLNTENDFEDKILQIAEVIKLYKYYTSINPVFTYKKELMDWISINIHNLLKINKEDTD